MRKEELPTYLSIDELAARWGMHRGSLCNWRVKGKGPKHVKVGKTILYAVVEVEAWEQQQTKRSTIG